MPLCCGTLSVQVKLHSNTPSKSSLQALQIKVSPPSWEFVHACLRSHINSTLGFPRMPASEVTTYSHLAAALLF